MIHLIVSGRYKMVSFLLILLIQFQTGSYNFLHASDSGRNSQELLYNHKLTNSQFGRGENSSKVEKKGSEKDAEFTWSAEEYHGEIMEISTKMDPLEIMIFEQKLLKLLGMKKRPRRDKQGVPVKVPKYLAQLYDNQLEKDVPTSNLNLPGRFTRSANTIRSFYHSGKERSLSGLNSHLRFDLSSIPMTEELTGGELRIPLFVSLESTEEEVSGSAQDFQDFQDFQVLVHDVVKIPKSSHNPPITYPIDSKSIKSALLERKSGSNFTTLWLTFDVFPAISRRSNSRNSRNSRSSRFSTDRQPNMNLNLAIEIIDRRRARAKSPEVPITTIKTKTSSENYPPRNNPPRNHNVRVRRSAPALVTGAGTGSAPPPDAINVKQNGAEVHVPMLLTYSDDGHNPRKPRDAKTLSRNYRSHQNQRRRRNHRHKNRRRNLCSRKKMFVDFTDVGWNDWIVAPPGYQAFFCSGECPFPMAEHLNATNHAVIQALVNSMNPRLVPAPCCVPNKYSSLSLLYTDSSDRIVLKNYNEMIVDSCGCS